MLINETTEAAVIEAIRKLNRRVRRLELEEAPPKEPSSGLVADGSQAKGLLETWKYVERASGTYAFVMS